MMRQREFGTAEEVDVVLDSIAAAAEASAAAVRDILTCRTPLGLLEAIKFEQVGRDPLDARRELNLIEQVNQTFTCLVTVRALEYLFRTHPESAPFRINPGAAAGTDIYSADGTVAAECFAATHPGSNQKLKKDIAKVRASGARHRYVFFYCPGEYKDQDHDGIRVIPVSLVRSDCT